jgi:hypothetical protein
MPTETGLVNAAGGLATEYLTDDHYGLRYETLTGVADPVKWPIFMPKPFTRMTPLGTDADGWLCVMEYVEYGPWRLRTPLKFHAEVGGVELRLDYDIDSSHTGDGRVAVDHGYIIVQREGTGVRVRTKKVLRINGTYPRLIGLLSPWLGPLWQVNSREFFHNAAAC